ncbi:MAG TPA: Rv3235 family protein [Streptosporangiaceae bacterium]|jgi:hypothetical protein|nr:Rv3235 family protein [Streptosporangiaceae bacterium]
MPSTPENLIPARQQVADKLPASPLAVRRRRLANRQRPLPDAQAVISALPVPDTAPPYDDADPTGYKPPVIEPLPGGYRPDAPGTTRSDPPPSPPAGAWPSQFAQVLSETLAGSRPASQLAPWTTQQARERIRQLGPMLAASRQPRVRRVIVTSPVQGVLEMTVIVDMGSRSRAVAVRLEHAASGTNAASAPMAANTPGARGKSHAAWLCTAVEAA